MIGHPRKWVKSRLANPSTKTVDAEIAQRQVGLLRWKHLSARRQEQRCEEYGNPRSAVERFLAQAKDAGPLKIKRRSKKIERRRSFGHETTRPGSECVANG
jgi:hypothetical protein